MYHLHISEDYRHQSESSFNTLQISLHYLQGCENLCWNSLLALVASLVMYRGLSEGGLLARIAVVRFRVGDWIHGKQYVPQ